MLELLGLTVRYGTTIALDDVSLRVGEGEVVALLGPNGAGKTSLLRAACRQVRSTGTIRFDGADATGLSTEELARRGLIHVPEGRHIFPTLSVVENLQLGLIPRRGRSGGWSLDDVFDAFPALAAIGNRSGYALSGGEQQMLAIGRALVAAPRLLLLDEPSLGLAPRIARAVFDVLGKVRDVAPILLVEQNSGLALGLADRAAVLSGGKVALDGSAEDLSSRSDLLASYLGRREAPASSTPS